MGAWAGGPQRAAEQQVGLEENGAQEPGEESVLRKKGC